jgi:flagellar motor switch protein FliM
LELLSAEERSALQAPYAAANGGACAAWEVVLPAVFPTVGQLDPDRMAALSAVVTAWIEALVEYLSQQLRAVCLSGPPHQQSIARSMLPLGDEAAIWGGLVGSPECRILVSLPRAFGAALCERVFGAPLQAREDRELSPAELSLLRGFAAAWLRRLGQLCAGQEIRLCETEPDDSPANWIRFTSELHCGPVQGAVGITMDASTVRLLLDGPPAAGSERHAREHLQSRLGEVSVELRAMLGQADFALDELAGLQIGDVIALDRAAQDPVDILIDGQPFYRAQAGLAGQRIAFELVDASPLETKDDG